jgi:hypothetical protein
VFYNVSLCLSSFVYLVVCCVPASILYFFLHLLSTSQLNNTSHHITLKRITSHHTTHTLIPSTLPSFTHTVQILTESDIEGFTEDILLENKNKIKSSARDEMSRIELSEWEENVKMSSVSALPHIAKIGQSKDTSTGKIGKDGKIIREGGPSGRVFRVVAMEPQDPEGVDALTPDPSHQLTLEDPMSHSTYSGTVSTGHMSAPMLTRSIDLAYSTIVNAVRKINSEALATLDVRYTARPVQAPLPSTTTTTSTSSASSSSSAASSSLSSAQAMAPTFGLTATQFFGIGLPFARHAIEMVPESCAALLFPSPTPQYRPSYRLPSKVLDQSDIINSSLIFSLVSTTPTPHISILAFL